MIIPSLSISLSHFLSLREEIFSLREEEISSLRERENMSSVILLLGLGRNVRFRISKKYCNKTAIINATLKYSHGSVSLSPLDLV